MSVALGVRETERKYEATAGFELSTLSGLGGFRVSESAGRTRMVATYFDTEDLRLLRAGVTLRRRTGGSDAGWHLKLPIDHDSREEIRLPLTRANRPPDQLLELVRIHTRGASVLPVAELTTTRRRLRLTEPDGTPMAELDDDLVDARTTVGDTAEIAWRELEVELMQGTDAETLDAIEWELTRRGMRPAHSGAKLARALAGHLKCLADERAARRA